MRLEKVEQIVDGVKALLPSGVEAEISMQGDEILVKYVDDSVELLNQDEFGNLIDAGVEVFDEPSQLIMERVDVTDNYIRTRLEEPNTCKPGSFRTKQVNNKGDKIILCKDKNTGKMKAQSKLKAKESYNADELFKLDSQIASIENNIMKVNDRINPLDPGSDLNDEEVKLFQDRDSLEGLLKRLKNTRDNMLNEELTPEEELKDLDKQMAISLTPEMEKRYKELRSTKIEVSETFINEDDQLKPYRVTLTSKDDSRPWVEIKYGKDKEDAIAQMTKYIQNKDIIKDITAVEEPEDHEEVTEKYFMRHMSSDGPDAQGEVTFKPTMYGYDYEATDSDFNQFDYKPKWTTLRTIDAVRNWFRNVLFAFGGEEVYIGDHHWNRSDFKENLEESLDKGFQASAKGLQKLRKFIKPEYLYLYKDLTDEEIDDMIKVENRLARKHEALNEIKEITKDECLNENKLCAMNRLEYIVKNCEDIQMRQRAISLLDNMGVGVDVKDEVEKLFKEINKKDKNMKENKMDIKNELSSLLEEVLDGYDAEELELPAEPKRYIVQQIGDDIIQEEFDCIIEAVNAYSTMASASELPVELIDTKNSDEVLATTAEDNKDESDEVNEDFTDTMIHAGEVQMTDVNDIDMPDALAATIATDEQGEILTMEKVVDKIDDMTNAITNKLDAVVQGVNNVETAVKAEETIIEPAPVETEEIADEVADQVADEIEDNLEDIEQEEQEEQEEQDEQEEQEEQEELEESYKKYITKGMVEDLTQTKQDIDKAAREGKSAEDVKDIIDIKSDNDKEKEEAEKYAIDKLTESLLSTSKNSILKSIMG